MNNDRHIIVVNFAHSGKDSAIRSGSLHFTNQSFFFFKFVQFVNGFYSAFFCGKLLELVKLHLHEIVPFARSFAVTFVGK